MPYQDICVTSIILTLFFLLLAYIANDLDLF